MGQLRLWVVPPCDGAPESDIAMNQTRDKTAGAAGLSPQTSQGAAPPQVPALRTPATAAPAARGRTRTWLWLGLGAAFAVALGGVAYVQPWQAAPPLVPIEIMAQAPVTRVLAVNGRIAAALSVDVRPLVPGRIEALLVGEGDVVQPGEVLARINDDTQNAVVRQAIAGLDAALVGQEGARQTLARSTALGANVAASTLEAQTRSERAAAQEVARMTALLDQAQIALANHTLRAPIGGSVLRLNVDPGQTVDPSSVLLTLADLTGLVVETDVDESYATQIAKGQKAVLQLAGENTPRMGQVETVSARVDVATGGLGVTLGFAQQVSAPVGLTVTANIVVEEQPAALTVPRTALVTVDGQRGVFVAESGQARFAPVQVVDWPAERLLVITGLAVGDALIADGTGLTDGQAVRVGTP